MRAGRCLLGLKAGCTGPGCCWGEKLANCCARLLVGGEVGRGRTWGWRDLEGAAATATEAGGGDWGGARDRVLVAGEAAGVLATAGKLANPPPEEPAGAGAGLGGAGARDRLGTRLLAGAGAVRAGRGVGSNDRAACCCGAGRCCRGLCCCCCWKAGCCCCCCCCCCCLGLAASCCCCGCLLVAWSLELVLALLTAARLASSCAVTSASG